MITDLQIAEKSPAGVTVTTKDNVSSNRVPPVPKCKTSTTTGNRHKYQTRIVSNANQVNLDFKDAKPAAGRSVGQYVVWTLLIKTPRSRLKHA